MPLALKAVRPEQDLKGIWTATDGNPACGCAIEVSSGINLQGKSSDKGKLSAAACTNPLLASAARWTLGHSFTGYDAPFELHSASGARVATLNRDGVDYFSGTLADGTPVTIWRKWPSAPDYGFAAKPGQNNNKTLTFGGGFRISRRDRPDSRRVPARHPASTTTVPGGDFRTTS